jgi:hypothetical protein
MANTTKATRHPPSGIPIPEEAYAQPTADDLANNQTYWEGYATGQAVGPAIPSPAGSNTYENYRTWVDPLLLPASHQGFVDNMAVGFNNAVIQGANWLWTNDPESPFKVPPA